MTSYSRSENLSQSQRELIVEREISRHAGGMSGYHGAGFSEHCRKAMMHATMLAKAATESEVVSAIAYFASEYQAGVAGERKRILDIDALAKQLPPQHDAMVRAAKFETPCTAGELAERIVAEDRRLFHKTPSARM
ncbi:MAG: hypothetical protein C3F19_11650 [Rhodocyclales bacterium]|jgi:hypothetical protein|nr:MAG: hypothetical protein C3F19_11650 [Rhodocyclales bacterium]